MVNKGLFAFFALWANLVLTSLIVSLFGQLNNALVFNTVLILNFLFVFLLYKAHKTSIIFKNTGMVFKSKKEAWFAALIFLLIGVLAVLSLITIFWYPPNNYDSMNYHLPRVFFYFSQGDLGHFYTDNDRQTFFPFNSTLFQMIVLHYNLPHFYFGLVNFSMWIVFGFYIYKLCRFLGVENVYALLSAFIGMTATAVYAQSTTNNNDIFVGAAMLAALYYLFCYVSVRDKLALIMAFICGGLAIGTKVTLIYFIPGFLVFSVLFAWKKQNRRGIISRFEDFKDRWAVIAMILGIVFAISSLFVNYYSKEQLTAPSQKWYRNHEYSPKIMLENASGITLQAFLNPVTMSLENIFYAPDSSNNKTSTNAFQRKSNALINTYIITPFWDRERYSGFPFYVENLISAKNLEDEIWYGAGFYLVVLGLLFFIFKKRPNGIHSEYLVFLIYLAAGFVISYFLLMKWQPWACRFFVPVFGMLSLFTVFFVKGIKHKAVRNAVLIGIIGLIFFDSVSYALNNNIRPLARIYNKDFWGFYEIKLPDNFPDYSSEEKVNIVWATPHGKLMCIYPFMVNSRGQLFTQSDSIKEGYYNIISVKDTVSEPGFVMENRAQYEYIGKMQTFLFVEKRQ